MLVRPSENLSLSGGIAYADARVDKFFTPPGSTPTVRDNTKLPLAPELKGSLAAQYRIALSSVDIIPSLLFAYTDKQYADLNEPAITLIPSYSTIDISIAIADKDDKYRVTLVGRNLTDESFAALITRGGPGGAPRLQIPRDADRYFGIQARVNFGGQ